jgi:hypothetical protein
MLIFIELNAFVVALVVLVLATLAVWLRSKNGYLTFFSFIFGIYLLRVVDVVVFHCPLDMTFQTSNRISTLSPSILVLATRSVGNFVFGKSIRIFCSPSLSDLGSTSLRASSQRTFSGWRWESASRLSLSNSSSPSFSEVPFALWTSTTSSSMQQAFCSDTASSVSLEPFISMSFKNFKANLVTSSPTSMI